MAALALAALALPALGLQKPACAGEAFYTSATGGGPDNLNSFNGILYSPFATLDKTGPLLRGAFKAFRFFYKTDLSATMRNVQIEAFGWSLEAEAGWQFAGKLGRIAAFAGAAWRDHTLAPNDPGSNLDNARIAASFSLDGAWHLTNTFGVMANANYLTGFDQFWTQARPYHQFQSGWKVGPEIAVAGGDDYTFGRAGAFVTGFELDAWYLGTIYLGGEAGAQIDLEDSRAEPYAGFHVGRKF